MKFAEYLSENLVPEWKDRYLDYKAGKKKIKEVTNSPNFLARPFTNSTPSGFKSHFTFGSGSGKVGSDHPPDESFSSLPPAAIETHDGGDYVGRQTARDQRNYGDRTPLLQAAQRAARSSAATTISSGLSHRSVQSEDSIHHHPGMSRQSTSKSFSHLHPQPYNSGPEIAEVPMKSSPQTGTEEFISWLDMELEMIDTFYKENEDQAVKRFLLLQDQLYHLRVEKVRAKAKTHQEELIKKSLAKTTDKFNKYELPSLPDFKFGRSDPSHEDSMRDYERHNHEVPYYIARRQLKVAVQEFYRGLELLKNYRMLNRTAFRKLLKKFDKKTNSSLSEKYMAKVNSSFFASSDVLDNLIPKVEDLFGSSFENGNRKIAVEKLRSNLKDDVFYTSTFFSGLLYGLSVPLSIYAIYLGVKTLENSVSKEVKFIFQIWAGFFLMILIAIFFAVDCYIWSKFKVNYKFIFEFNQRHCLNSKQMHLLPAFFLFLLSIFGWFSFNDFWPNAIPSRDWPWFFFGFALFIILLPVNILFLESRKWLVSTIWRLALSGFYPVEFKDFFLGDIFCSLTYTMGNISFFFCVYATHWKDADIGDPVCGSSRSRLMGFFATLPSIWRTLQCLRRYSDSGDWFPHLANMVKYSVAIGYYVMLSVYRIDRSETNRGLFILIATMNSVYSSLWDVFMDWSLMQDQTLLRSRLIFPRWSYYAAIVSNFLLRFQWIFYALFSQQIQQSALTSFFVGIAEIIRRFIWLIIRMENEHIANIHSYRASREVRLPYETLTRDGASVISRQASTVSLRYPPSDIEANADLRNVPSTATGASAGFEEQNVKRRGTIMNSSVFQNVSKAIVTAHAKDFQRRKTGNEVELASNSSDDDNSDDESVIGNGR